MKEKTSLGSKILSLCFAVLSVFWLIPVFLTLINSFKSNNFVNLEAFSLPNAESFVGMANYIKGMTFGDYPFIKAAGFSFLITIPQITVTIRRLHDVGRSGKWLLANIVLTIVAFCGTIGFFATAFSESSRIREAEYVQVDGEWYHKDNLPTRDEEMMSGDSELRLHNPASAPEMHMWVLRGLKADFPVRVLLLGALLPMGLAGLISLYILILCFIDSHRGPNRYGPSSKYPTA